jgi:hypothetical protein
MHCLFTSAITPTAASSATRVGATRAAKLDVGCYTVAGDAPTDNCNYCSSSSGSSSATVVISMPHPIAPSDAVCNGITRVHNRLGEESIITLSMLTDS